MVTVAIAKSLTSYIPMMYADNLEQGLQVCRLLKEIEPKETRLERSKFSNVSDLD